MQISMDLDGVRTAGANFPPPEAEKPTAPDEEDFDEYSRETGLIEED